MSITIDKKDLKLRIADWESENKSLAEIRRKVFIEEQNVPEDMEWDNYDQSSIHYLATVKDEIIAVARLKPDGQLGRMAVLSNYRNQGIGSELLRYILRDIKTNKLKNIYLHAQITALNFYSRQGFIENGEIFYEADIPHKKMHLED